MKLIFPLILVVISLITTGCTPVDTISVKEIKNENDISPIKVEEDSHANILFDNNYEFTYLEEMPEVILDKYNLFFEDGNTVHLIDFTPEQIA